MSRKKKKSAEESVEKNVEKDIYATEALNEEHKKMLEWLKKLKFKKKLLGGVKESDVWKKISELNRLYEAALSAERARYDTLIGEQIVYGEKKYRISLGRREGAEDGRKE